MKQAIDLAVKHEVFADNLPVSRQMLVEHGLSIVGAIRRSAFNQIVIGFHLFPPKIGSPRT